MEIDLNCDCGEAIGDEKALMPFISSASIACGYHAGDVDTMVETMQLCAKHNVNVGAHPSFLDRANFGRNMVSITPAEIYELITQQLIIFNEVATNVGQVCKHVKPHGALYNLSAKDIKTALAIAEAVRDFNQALVLIGLSGSKSILAARETGLKTASEAFADRTYNDDGSLTPRTEAGSMINNADQSVAQVLQIINDNYVTSVTGKQVKVMADTICIHGDGEHALEFAKLIHTKLKQSKIAIKAF